MREGTFRTYINEDREYFIFRDAVQPEHLLTVNPARRAHVARRFSRGLPEK